jgi:hypothetical protein
MNKVHEGMAGDSLEVESGGVVQVNNGGRVQTASGGEQRMASGSTLNLESGAVQKVAGTNVPASVGMAAAAGGANVCEVTFTVQDAAGATIAGVFNLDIWLSDAASGAGLTATSASGAVAAKSASGADLGTLTAKKALRVQTLATGIYTLSITDAAKTGFYPCAQVPGLGRTNVGTQLITGNYG